MKYRLYLLLGCLTLLAALTGCSGGQTRLPSAERCGEIVDEPFLTIPPGTPPSEALEQRVVQAYALSPEELGRGDGSLWWEANESHYLTRHTATGGVLVERSWGWSTKQPTAEEVLYCFGQPAAYDAYTYQDMTAGFVLVLWYPGQGEKNLMVESAFFSGTDVPLAPAQFTRRIPTRYEGDIPITRMYTGDMTFLLSSPRLKLKPWPGKAEDIVIEQMRRVDR